MKRSIWLSAAILAVWAGTSDAGAPPGRPNVLFIIADDLNCELGCYGRAVVKSPHIDRLAALGVRFDRAYCQYALCNPSRASFLSGRRPENGGVVDQGTAVRARFPDAVFLPQLFRENAWFTAGIGKVFHSVKQSDLKCWDLYDQTSSEDPQEIEAIKRRYANPVGKRTPDWAVLDGPEAKTMDGRTAERIAALMEEKAKAGKPFFLSAGFQKPHLPWAVPRKYFDLYPAGRIAAAKDPPLRSVPPIALMTELSPCPPPASRVEAIAAYYSAVSFMDAQVGQLLRHLDRLKLWDNTIVVLIGDNGFHLGDHDGLWSKMTTFEQAARVPVIVVAPGCAHGKTCTRTVELVDLYPTLVELCGLARPEGLEGTSLVPLLKRPDAGWDRPARTIAHHRDVCGKSVRTARWRYTEWDDGKQGVELYDHDTDTEEYTNLAGDAAHAKTVQDLRRLLKP